MHLLARRIAERQAAAKDLLEMIEEPAPWLAVVERLSAMDGARLPDQVRELLGISLAEQGSWSSGHAALRAWIDATEALGILVMQDGSMDLDVMRGFAAQDDVVPAVVINTKDDPRARVFTIVHELGHLVRAARGVPDGPEFEPWCNDFSGEVLMPSAAVTTEWRRHAEEPVAERVAAIARTFQVTRLAAAVRVARAHLLSEAEASSVIGAIRAKPPPPAPRRGGGDYYWNQIGALGPRFTRLILDAVGAQAITYPAASMLLGGVKANHMATLREYLDKRYEGH
jgi:Zn-dependent peptidase ImmA (M78 family)